MPRFHVHGLHQVLTPPEGFLPTVRNVSGVGISLTVVKQQLKVLGVFSSILRKTLKSVWQNRHIVSLPRWWKIANPHVGSLEILT